MQSFVQRMIGAAKLDVATYEEVEHDRSATAQAAAVVILSSLAAGIGALGQGFGIQFLVITALAALVGWLIWAAIIWLIGTKMLPQQQTEADIAQLLRTMGFAAAPGLLRVFEIIPVIGAIIGFVVAIWMLVTMVIAVRQALDYDNTWRAVGVCLVGWVIQVVILMVIGGLFHGAATSSMGQGTV